MSLSWNVNKIKNHKEVCYDDTGALRPTTELLVFTTIHVGLGEITEKNADEFYARMTIVHKLHDLGIRLPDGKNVLLDPKHVYQHIGLVTNVSNETRAQWSKRWFSDKHTSITADFARFYRQEVGKMLDNELAS